MADFDPQVSFEADPALAEIRLEFAEGLAGRLSVLRAALEALAVAYDAESADRFFRTAHSLKGTAPSFGADQVAVQAESLTQHGRAWVSRGECDAAELDDATAVFRRLEEAAEEFRERVMRGR